MHSQNINLIFVY